MIETNTFTLGEWEKENYYSVREYEVRYCSYCGKKAIREDIGSVRDEDIIYYCDCEDAEKEKELKKKRAKLSDEVYLIEKEIEKMKELENNETVRKIKFEHEYKKLKEKYKIDS